MSRRGSIGTGNVGRRFFFFFFFFFNTEYTLLTDMPSILTLLYNAVFQLSFFLMAPNFLALATTLENLGARWPLAKKVNFVPWIRSQSASHVTCLWLLVPRKKYDFEKLKTSTIGVPMNFHGIKKLLQMVSHDLWAQNRKNCFPWDLKP